MIRDLGEVRPGTTIYVPFHTFDSNDPSASVTITGLATTDIEIYKDGSVTQRASDAGYTLLDTDGIDFDTTTGIHGVSIDLANNTTAGFYAAGSQYMVVIASITVDAATINFIPVTFTIGYPNALINTTIATLASQTSFTLTSGPAENDALNGMWCLIHDVASAVQLGYALISDYVGSTKTVTLVAGTTFTAAATDNISIMGMAPLQPATLGNTLAADGNGRIDVGSWLGTAVTTSSTTNKPEVDISSISDDATAANNLELQYDTTGLTGDTFPASQAQVGNIASGTAAISTVAESYTLTTGTQSSGLYTDTVAEDGTNHEHTDTAGAMELYYQFDVGGNGTAVEADMDGYLTSANDSLDVFAYNWSGASWEQVGTLNGGSASNTAHAYNLTTSHTGTGANLGKVRLRFYAAAGLTSATLAVDRITCSYAVVSQSTGYAMGAVWIDTTDGVAGTESFVNGVADNPTNSLANAITIASNVGLERFISTADSTITYAESHTNEVWNGMGWTLALGSQDISGSHIHECQSVTGIATTPSAEAHFVNCEIGNVTIGNSHFVGCGFEGTLTLGAASDYFIVDGYSKIAGASAPTIDMGAAVGASNLAVRNWSGGLTINNLAAGDVVSLDGTFGTITLNGADATVEIRGIAKAVTNNLTGSPTVNDDSIKADDVAAILADTNELQSDDVPGLIAGLNDPTAATIADAVWDETLADHLTAGSTGNALNAAGSAGDPWSTAIPGAYGAGTAGNIVGNNLDAAVSDTATATALATAQTDLTAIVADTNELQTDWANGGRLDLIIDAILADTNELQTDWTNGGRLDLLIDQIVAGTPTAAQLAYLVAHSATAVPVTFTGGTTTTAVLGNVDSAAASSTDDVYNSRVLIFNTGTLNYQISRITDYTGATTTATITAVTTAVTGSHTAIMV